MIDLESFGTQYYDLVIGEEPESLRQMYQCRNKETGVIEYEDTILSRAIETIRALDQTLFNIIHTEVHNELKSKYAESDGIH